MKYIHLALIQLSFGGCILMKNNLTSTNCKNVDSYSGVCQELYETNEIKAKYLLKNGKLHGTQYRYFPRDKTIYIEEYHKGSLVKGKAIIYHDYLTKPDVEYRYNNNYMTDGNYIIYYQEGNVMSKGRYGVCKGFLVSKIDSFSRGNVILADTISESIKVGKWKEYYKNGKLKSVKYYDKFYLSRYDTLGLEINVNLDGAMTDNNAIRITRTTFDLKNGTWKYYSEQGKLIKEGVWNKGNLVEVRPSKL